MAIEYMPQNHIDINLRRLVRRLEKSVASQHWGDTDEDKILNLQSTLQKLRFTRRLLEDSEMSSDPELNDAYQGIKLKLDLMETVVKDANAQLDDKPQPSQSFLSRLPLPQVTPTLVLPSSSQSEVALPMDNLLLSPSDSDVLPSESIPLFPSLIPQTLPHSRTNAASSSVATGATPRFLQNSTALQEELTEQLAQMSTQLKRNAIHFSESLAKDQAVVKETEQKLEGNYDVMTKQRVRLRDHSSKSGSTTCLTMFIILAVLLLFMVMVSLIRFT